MVAWTKYASQQNGEQIRESWYALGATSTLYKEVVKYAERPAKSFTPTGVESSGKIKAACESIIAIAGYHTLTALTWTLESSSSSGEEYSELWSAPSPLGGGAKIYRETTTHLDASAGDSKAFPTSPSQIRQEGVKDVSQSMALAD